MVEKSLILISGGMDSAVCAGIASKNSKQQFGLHINYGQRTEARELKAFNDICNHYKFADKKIVDIGYLAEIGGSSLTDRKINVSNGDLDSKEVPSSYVPFRNANILAIAVAWAEVLSAEEIYIGAMEEDSSGYPDCRASFFKSFEQTIELGTRPETNISIRTPIINKKKSEIIKLGMQISVPFEKTWSCYKSEDIACGRCDSCLLRLRGWKEAELTDPIKYI